MVGAVLALRLSPDPQQQEEGTLPLPSSCVRLEGIHYLPGYRQLSEAIFQLCAFKELIGSEIILSRQSRRRHNLIRLPRGLLVLSGDPAGRVSLSAHPGRGCTQGVTAPGAPCQPGDATSSTEGDRIFYCSMPGLGVPLSCPCPSFFAPHFPPHSRCSGSAWHSTLRQTHPRHCKPTGDACSNRAPGPCWGCLAQPAPPIPAGQPCPPAPWLKSIIQIILAWRHGSVAVTNSSEARRARVVNYWSRRLPPSPAPSSHQDPQPASTSRGAPCPPNTSPRWAQCTRLMLDAMAQLMGARPGPEPPATACAVPQYPRLPGPQITRISLQRG